MLTIFKFELEWDYRYNFSFYIFCGTDAFIKQLVDRTYGREMGE